MPEHRYMLRSWLLSNCRFAQQQLLLDYDEPGAFSADPKEHASYEKDLSPTTPEGMGEEEFVDGFFHVTTNLGGVLSWGALRSRKSLGDVPGLGGGVKNEAANKISLTYNAGKAWQIYSALKFAAEVARGGVRASEILNHYIQEFVVPDEVVSDPRGQVRSVLSRFGVPDSILDDEFVAGLDESLDKLVRSSRKAYDFMIALEDALAADAEGENYEGIPTRVGFTVPFEIFSRIDPSNIAILKLEVRKNAPYEHVPGELELRFSQDDVRLSANPIVSR